MRKSPAQVYALVFGITLLLAGILGFFYTADFSTGKEATQPGNTDALIGVFDVNGWHNVVHVLSGLLHLGIALLGLLAAIATPSAPPPTMAGKGEDGSRAFERSVRRREAAKNPVAR